MYSVLTILSGSLPMSQSIKKQATNVAKKNKNAEEISSILAEKTTSLLIN